MLRIDLQWLGLVLLALLMCAVASGCDGKPPTAIGRFLLLVLLGLVLSGIFYLILRG